MWERTGVIISYELRNSSRKLADNVKAHPLFTVFFIFIFLCAIAFSVVLGWRIYILTQEGYDFYFEHGTLATVYGVLIMGKAGTSVYNRTLRRKDNVWFMSSASPAEPIAAMVVLEVISVALLILFGMGIVLLFIFGLGFHFLPPVGWLAEGLLIGLNAILASFFVPIYLNVQARFKRYLLIVLSWGYMSAFFGTVRYLSSSPYYFSSLLIYLCAAALLLGYSVRYYREAWAALASKSSAPRLLGGSLLQRLSSSRSVFTSMVVKELRTTFRERDALTTQAMSVFLAGALVYLFYNPEFLLVEGISSPTLVFAASIVVTMFIALELQCNLMGAESLGMEGSRFYVYKTTPVSGQKIISAKVTALLMISIPLSMLIVLPVALLAGMPPSLIITLSVLAVALALGLSAVGIYFGTRYPNFAEGEGGSPDLVTLLTISFMGMFATVPIAGAISGAYYLLGPPAVLVALDVTGWCMAALISSVEVSGRAIDRIEGSAYL